MSPSLAARSLAPFRDAAVAHVGDEQVPGLVALVARGGEAHVEALGSLSVGGPPVRRDSLFRISSMTKPMTAVAALALVREGRLRLDEPVDRLLPELAERRVLRRMDGPLDETVPADRPIIVRELLNFTFGFGATREMFAASEPWPVVLAANDLHLSTVGPPNPDEQPDPDTWMAGLGSLPLLAQPGERWLYSTGASVLGVLDARAAGEPFADVLRSRIFEPLGRRDTAFWTSDTDRLATAYRPSPDGLVVWDEPSGTWSHPPAFGDGSAGLVSSADDLWAFARMLLRGGGPVLAREAVAEMTRDQLAGAQKAHGGLSERFFDDRSWGYCLSVINAGARAGAYGWDGGFGTSWLVDPGRDLTVVVLTQRMFESPEPPPVHRDLQEAAYSTFN